MMNIKLVLSLSKGLGQGYLLLLFRQDPAQPSATEGQVILPLWGLGKPQYKSGW